MYLLSYPLHVTARSTGCSTAIPLRALQTHRSGRLGVMDTAHLECLQSSHLRIAVTILHGLGPRAEPIVVRWSVVSAVVRVAVA